MLVKIFNIKFLVLVFCLTSSLNISADDSFFDDDVAFDETESEFDDWSDDSDIFSDESTNNEKPFAWLDLEVNQKWGGIIMLT